MFNKSITTLTLTIGLACLVQGCGDSSHPQENTGPGANDSKISPDSLKNCKFDRPVQLPQVKDLKSLIVLFDNVKTNVVPMTADGLELSDMETLQLFQIRESLAMGVAFVSKSGQRVAGFSYRYHGNSSFNWDSKVSDGMTVITTIDNIRKTELRMVMKGISILSLEVKLPIPNENPGDSSIKTQTVCVKSMQIGEVHVIPESVKK